MPQCPWTQAGQGRRWSGQVAGGGDDIDDFDTLVAVAGDGASDLGDLRGAGEVDPRGCVDDLDGAPAPPAVPAAEDAVDGNVGPGQLLARLVQGGLVVLDGEHVVPPAPTMARAVSCWVCIASTVTTTPASSKPARRVRTAGISLLLAATASCPSTVPLAWSNAATRCGAPGSRRRAPRMVLPSIAITRRPPCTVVRVHSQAPITAARASASRRPNTRRNVDSSGARPGPSPVVPAGVCAAAHSPIAANERAPVMTALNPTASSCDSGCRTPRRARGSGTAANNVSSAVSSATRSDPAAAVGEDGMSGCGPRARWLM